MWEFLICILGFIIVCVIYYFVEESKKSPEQKQKEKELTALQLLYKRGEINFQQYDIMKAKIEGRKSMTDIMGYEAASAAGHKIDVDNAVAKLSKDNERGVILGSAIGNGIGGLGGGIIGGLSAAAQGNAEMNELLKEQANADAAYRDALNRSTKQ